MLGGLWYIRAGSELYQYLSQYPRGSHAFRATIIIARGEQSYLGISRYLGVTLVARYGYGRLPLFHHTLCRLW